MNKPRFDLWAVEAEGLPPLPEPRRAPPPEPSQVGQLDQVREGRDALYVRVPTSLNEAVKQLARERSAKLRTRVTVNDLVVEALENLLRK
jgi:hypothetical protein